MVNEQRAIEQFMELVRISSVSTHERAVADYISAYFRKLGYEVIEDMKSKAAVANASAGNIIVKIPGQGNLANEPAILLSAHMDTVEPGENIKPQLSADRLRVVSDGTTILGADDKGGIAQIIELTHILREQELAHPPLELVFQICEEVGLLGSLFIDTSLITAKQLYVLDGGIEVGVVVIGSPTMYDVSGKITGKAAHAGVEPDKGISSIQVLAKAIAEMKLLKIDEETTSNIGFVKTDYPLNVVPEVTTFGFEARSLDDAKAKVQLQSMVDALERATKEAGATLELNIEQVLTAHKLSPDNPVLQHYHKVCAANGITVEERMSRGGTDLSSYMSHGLDGIAITSGGRKGHTLEEYLDIPTFIAAIALVAQLVSTKME